jgi:hypothetical protein
MSRILIAILLPALIALSCSRRETVPEASSAPATLLDKYISVPLTADLQHLSDAQKRMIPLLIEAADIMDELFWQQAYGDPDALLNGIPDEALKAFAIINYGPWDRLDGNRPFLPGTGEKPLGANFYPPDMTKEEFEGVELDGKADPYTLLRRDESGKLTVLPYHVAYADKLGRAAALLEEAADLEPDPGFQDYLRLRAAALRSDRFFDSDMAWMDMKNNRIDLVIGPIENYEDKLYNYKTAYEAYVLIKDLEWSARLEKYAAFLPELQRGLPVPEAYKKEEPGSNADLNAYDVAYYAGDCNAGSKTIAINLPNDEEVQLRKGSRRLQLKNAMRAKFDNILLPIASEVIAEEQRKHVGFDAFFANTMFHEVAHGLGIKNTLDGRGSVRNALMEHYSAIEEGKADILGLYMVTELHRKGELQGELMDYYATFLAGIFRSVRFGAASAHGKANMICFNYFQEAGAFTRSEDGKYSVDLPRMQEAVAGLSRKLLTLQGDGDYGAATELLAGSAVIGPVLQEDLARFGRARIPVDVVFEQGLDVLGLGGQ